MHRKTTYAPTRTVETRRRVSEVKDDDDGISELNDQSLLYIIDIARPKKDINDILIKMTEETCVMANGKKKNFDFTNGLDFTREISECIFSYIDDVVKTTKQHKPVKIHFIPKTDNK